MHALRVALLRSCAEWGEGEGARFSVALSTSFAASPRWPQSVSYGGTVMIGATYARAIADAGEPAFCKVSHCSKANSTAAQNSCSL
jgi:hypothetical protein